MKGAEFAGRLREQVVFLRAETARTATGARGSGWYELLRCRAAVEPEGVGAEREGEALSAMPRFRVTVRLREGISVGDRVRWKTRLMEVRRVIEDPALPDRLTMRCEEVRA